MGIQSDANAAYADDTPVDKNDVRSLWGGLSNVDNTSDADKPISTAQQAALDAKANTSDARLTDAREWVGETVSQAEAEAGTGTTRRAWTAQRIHQAIANYVSVNFLTVWKNKIWPLNAKENPVDGDVLSLLDTEDDNAVKKLTMVRLRIWLQGVFDSRYATSAQGTNAREWVGATVSQAEAEAGTATTRRAWTAQRHRQGILKWWADSTAKAKLDGIETVATANSTDAALRDRNTHTGTQAISTITGLAGALDGKAQAESVAAISAGLASLDGEVADALVGKAAANHVHGVAAITGLDEDLAAAGASHQPAPGQTPSAFVNAEGVRYDAQSIVVTADGPALRMTGQAVCRVARAQPIGPEDADQLRFRAVRSADVEDPAGDAVEFGVNCYSGNGQILQRVVLATENGLNSAGAEASLRLVVGRTAGGAVEMVLPAGTRSYAPFAHVYNSNPGLDLHQLERQRVTGAGSGGSGLSADAAGPLAERDDYDGEAAGFVYAVTTESPWEYYIRSGASGWTGPETVVGPQGEPGISPDGAAQLAAILKPEGGINLPPLDCIGAITIDAETGEVLASQDPDAVGYPASTAKAMTFLLAEEHITDWSEEITVTADVADETVMITGDVLSLDAVRRAAMIVSNNAACDVIARHIGLMLDPGSADPVADYIALMNAKAAMLGMDDTVYTLTFGDSSGATATARDLATLWREVYRTSPDLVSISRMQDSPLQRTGPNARTTTLHHSVDFVQAGNYPAMGGGKSGTSSAAGANLVWDATTRDGRPLIHAMIGASGDIERYTQCAAMMTQAAQSWAFVGDLPLRLTTGAYRAPVGIDLENSAPTTIGTWSRATAGTYLDDSGHLADSAPNAPRYDYGENSLALRGVLFEPAVTNGIPNSIGTGSVAADEIELNDVPLFTGTGSWLLSDTGGSSAATISGGTLTLTGDGGLDQGRADYEMTGLTVGHIYRVEFPEGVADNAITVEVGTAQGGDQITGTVVISTGTWRGITFEATATTAWVRLGRFSSGTATIPACSIQHCGRLPTGWRWDGFVGAVVEVVTATRRVEGFDAIDLRFRGETTSTGFAFVSFGTGTDAPSAVDGIDETWATSIFARRVAGSDANIDVLHRVSERDGSGAYVGVFTSDTMSGIATPPPLLAQARTWVNKGMVSQDTKYLLLGLTIEMTEDAAFDITVQIANPQMERYRNSENDLAPFAAPTSVIRSAPDDASTWTRDADVWTITGLAVGPWTQMLTLSTERSAGTAQPVQDIIVPQSGGLVVAKPPALFERHIRRALYQAR